MISASLLSDHLKRLASDRAASPLRANKAMADWMEAFADCLDVQSAEGFRPENIVLGSSIGWVGATSGMFDAGRMWHEGFGAPLEPEDAVAACLTAFGPPTPAAGRLWQEADYILTTPIDGVYLEVRLEPPTSHGRRFAYLLHPAIDYAIDCERRAPYQDQDTCPVVLFDEPKNWSRETLGRHVHEALLVAVNAVGNAALACRPVTAGASQP